MGKRKPKAIEAFEDNMADARLLVGLAKALTNTRTYRPRKELRAALSQALKMRKRDYDEIDVIESSDFFVVLKPRSAVTRHDVADMRPLLRQAIVAACAAFETYVGDRVMELLGPVLRQPEKPRRLLDIGMTVRDWYEILERYKRRGWGVRVVVERAVRELASPAPSSIGRAFAIVGRKDLLSAVDSARGLPKGASETCLQRIYERRNRIAHAGDRHGRGRASITHEEVDADLNEISQIVEVLDLVTATAP